MTTWLWGINKDGKLWPKKHIGDGNWEWEDADVVAAYREEQQRHRELMAAEIFNTGFFNHV